MAKKPAPKRTECPIDSSNKLLEDLIDTALALSTHEDVIVASGNVLKAAYEYSVYMRNNKE